MGIVIDYTKGFFEASPAGETVGDISTGTLDLSSGNVFSYTPTADTTFVFNNPPATGTAYGMTLKVTGANVGSTYDIANASYDSVSFGPSSGTTKTKFSSDGTKLYVSRDAGPSYIYQYNLSTAWDITSSSSSAPDVTSIPFDTFVQGFDFKSDGTKLYTISYSTDTIKEYDLSTAWDVSTAVYTNNSISSIGPRGIGVFIHPDGTKIYSCHYNSGVVKEWPLSTAFDLSSAGTSVSYTAINTQTSLPFDIVFNSNGTSFFVVDLTNDKILRYSMSTAWDVSTASYEASDDFSVASQDTTPVSVEFKSDGSKMYVFGGSNDTIYQYSTTGTSAPATFTYPTSVDWPSGTAPDAPADGETDVLVFYTEDGGTTYYGFQAGGAMA